MPDGLDHWWEISSRTDVTWLAREAADSYGELAKPWLEEMSDLSHVFSILEHGHDLLQAAEVAPWPSAALTRRRTYFPWIPEGKILNFNQQLSGSRIDTVCRHRRRLTARRRSFATMAQWPLSNSGLPLGEKATGRLCWRFDY